MPDFKFHNTLSLWKRPANSVKSSEALSSVTVWLAHVLLKAFSNFQEHMHLIEKTEKNSLISPGDQQSYF